MSNKTAKIKQIKRRLLPKLRFHEFHDTTQWEIKPLGEICDILNNKRRPISGSARKSGAYPYYGASGIVDYVDNYIFDERLLLVGEDGAKWSSSEKTAFIADGKYWVNNHAHVLKAKGIIDTILESYLVMIDLSPFVTGAAPPKLTLGKLKGIPIPVSKSKKEQQKIADCLSSVEELIMMQGQKVDALKKYKKGLTQQLFPREGETTPRLRFPEFHDAGEWEIKSLEYYLDYQQPTAHLVSDTNYSDDYETPVLTAGKTFLLGYTNEKHGIFKDDLPVVIFDDFTTATQFVDFPFKAKSSAMKILRAKNGANIKFMHEAIKMIPYEVGSHERHWISKFAPMLVLVPKPKEQQKIASCISSLDDLITAQSKKLETIKAHKKGLMQQLFPTLEELRNE